MISVTCLEAEHLTSMFNEIGLPCETRLMQDEIICSLIGLARSAQKVGRCIFTDELMLAGLNSMTADVHSLEVLSNTISQLNAVSVFAVDPPLDALYEGDNKTRSLRSVLLFGIRGLAAQASFANDNGFDCNLAMEVLHNALIALVEENTNEKWLHLFQELGMANLSVSGQIGTVVSETI